MYRHTITADIIEKHLNSNSKGIDCNSDNGMLQTQLSHLQCKMHTLSLVIMKAGVNNEFLSDDE